MCGISGILNFQPGQAVDKILLQNLNQRMTRRGPDHSGFWYSNDQQVGLSHNRLSFIDLNPRSNQPLSYLGGRYVITYNGEIYNYETLKTRLISRGYKFSTTSDTEVIMAMYDCYGVAMLKMLRGMFAFAIWDEKQQKIFAAKDPFGIKPFYYYLDNDRFIFASQVKAISEQSQLNLTASAGGWCGFITYGSVPEPLTTYQEIKALSAGNYLEISKSGDLRVKEYFSVYDEFAKIEGSLSSEINFENIDQAFSESIDYHLVADVPVGLFLSSGIDSTVLASYLQKYQKDELVAFTLDFDEFGQQNNESTLASLTAENYGLNHQIVKFDLNDIEMMLEDFFVSMDQPSIDGLNVWMISKAVSQAGYRAVLSGLGADEVLAGYPSFQDVPKYSKTLSVMQKISQLGLPVERLGNLNITKQLLHPKLKGFSNNTKNTFLSAYHLKRNLFLTDDLDLFFDNDFIAQGQQELDEINARQIKNLNMIENSYLKTSALELDNYMKNQLLKDADWASMYHSLELRVPFVDFPLIKACATEVVKMKRPCKKEVIKQTLNGRLLNGILTRKKTGFETPVKEWLQTMPGLQSWKSKEEFRGSNYPWARRWAHEVKNRFLN